MRVDSSAIVDAGHPGGFESIDLNLFPDVDLTAVRERFERRGPGRSAWIGKIADDPASSVVLVQVEGLVAGTVFAHGRHYAIRGGDAGSQEVVEIDQSAFPPEACDQPPAADAQVAPAAPAAPLAQADAASLIDVMVVYTPAARARQGSAAAMEALSATAVALTNTSYANSGVAPRLNLVHTAEVAYTETKSPTGYATDLQRLQNPADGFMDGVQALRNTYRADVVVLLVDAADNYPSVCGYAYLAPGEAHAFALVADDCASGNLSFGHEIGHLQGARHDRYVDAVDGPTYSYNHGDVDLASRQRTIMAYNNECQDKLPAPNNYCDRILYWSNPAKEYPGTLTPMGSLDHENNALVLNNTAATVANFRQNSATLTVQSAYPASGVTVAVDPADDGGLGDGTTPFARTYHRGTPVTLTAPATEPLYGNPLQGWSGCMSVSGNVCSVTLDADTTVTANYVTSNQQPTLAAIADLTINEDAGPRTVNLSGISAGAGESQALAVTAVSSNPALIPDPTVNYASPAETGSLVLTPAADANGTATITVTVDDGQATFNTVVRTFLVTVNPVNDPPLFTKGSDQTVPEDAGARTVVGWATDIAPGPANESGQTLAFTTTNDNNSLFSVQPAVAFDGTLTFTPAPNANGSATVTVRLRDNGGTANGGSDTSTDTFLVKVLPVNDPPAFVKGGNRTVREDAGSQRVTAWATSISPGPANESGQAVAFTTTNDNNSLFSVQPAVSPTGTLTFTPAPSAYGSATVSVQLLDSGGTANGGNDASGTQTFTIAVSAVNDAPTLDAIPQLVIGRNAGLQTIPLSGISAGPGEVQPLTVTASSSNTGLIPKPAVTYAGGSTGSLNLTPAAGKSGAATITVRVSDGQATNNAVVRTFRVVVNDPPTLDPLPDLAIDEDPGLQTVRLAGIRASADGLERQTLTVTVSSSNTALVPKPTVGYTSPNTMGVLRFTPAANASGTALITVRVSDGQSANNIAERSFTVTVAPVNDTPTLNAIAARTINEDAAPQTVALSGISAGGGEAQSPVVTARSSNPGLIPDPVVTYGGGATGSLTFAPAADASGTATITVTVDDGQAANNSRVRTFTVTVLPVNDRPTLIDPFADQPLGLILDEDAPEQTVTLGGISAGGGESQKLTVTALSSNTALIPNPTVSYTSPGATGILRFTPVKNAWGKATVTVRVSDGQPVNSTVSRSFLVTVNAVNDPPTLNAIAGRTLLENAGWQTVNLGGITAGPKESQKLTVTALSSNTALIPSPTVTYTSPNATGTLRFKPAANASGASTITVTVDDGQAVNNTFSRSFLVAVNPLTAAAAPALADAATVPPLTASFVGSVNGAATENPSGPAPLAVAFDAGGSTGPNPIVVYEWDFGDGQASSTASGAVTHEFAATGSYFVTLTVTDSLGGKDTTQRLVTAAEDALTVSTSAELQAALETATAGGRHTVIRLAGGAYPLSGNWGERFAYSSAAAADLVIEGGWTADFSQRAANIPTRLVGDIAVPMPGAGGVLAITAGGSVTADGLEIVGGNADGNGGGLYVSASGQIAVANCQVLDNAAGGDGGGMYLESTGGGVRLSGSAIRGNSAASGGGATIRAAAVAVHANEISANTAAGADGGLQATVLAGGSLGVGNNTIFGNRAVAGASGLSVAAAAGGAASLFDVRNNIVYGNGAAPNFVVAADCSDSTNQATLAVVNNDIESYALCPGDPLDATNVSVDFGGRAAGDARLAATDTALIDRGATAGAPPADLDGEALPLDGDGDGFAVPDIGADEFNPWNVSGPAALTVDVSGPVAAAGGGAVVTVTLDQPAKRDMVFSLESSDTAAVVLSSPYVRLLKGASAARVSALPAPGSAGGSATVTATDPSGLLAPGSAVVTVSAN